MKVRCIENRKFDVFTGRYTKDTGILTKNATYIVIEKKYLALGEFPFAQPGLHYKLEGFNRNIWFFASRFKPIIDKKVNNKITIL